MSLSYPTITVQQFQANLANTVMDDLIESIAIKNQLVTLQSRISSLTVKNTAINSILKGLQRENTPLSDYYIQSSVASLLEYISKQQSSLLSDPNIITVAGQLFQQMTIGENKYIQNGKYAQFGRAAT